MRRTLSLFILLILLAAVTSVAAQVGETYYVKTASARVRDSADTHGAVVATIRRNTAVQVLDVVDGTKVSKSTVWYHIQLGDGTEGYIHSSLVTDKVPRVPIIYGSNPVVTPVPGQTSVSTVLPTSAPVASTGASCNGATTCSQMTSCEQAYACLAAGRSSLDRDKDGVPCESICPGG